MIIELTYAQKKKFCLLKAFATSVDNQLLEVVWVWESQFCSIGLYILFLSLSHSHAFLLLWFLVSLNNWDSWVFHFTRLILLGYIGPLDLMPNFIFCKNRPWEFERYYMESVHDVGSIAMLPTLSLSSLHGCVMSFFFFSGSVGGGGFKTWFYCVVLTVLKLSRGA